MANVVKGDFGVDPGEVLLCALELVVDDVDLQPISLFVYAFVELSAEELHAHDGEDEPEDEAHEEHVEDGGNGVHQGVDNDLKHKSKKLLESRK